MDKEDEKRVGFSVFVPIHPVPWTAPFVGKRGSFSSEKYSQFRKGLKELLQLLVAKSRPSIDLPFGGEVWISTIFILDQRSNLTKPDLSNLVKALEDGMSGVIIKDDKQITRYLEPMHKVTIDSANPDPGILLDVIFIEPT